MFDKALVFLRDQMNTFIRLKTGDSSEKVVLYPLVDPSNGSVAITSEHIGMTLVNIEEERVFRGAIPQMIQNGDAYGIANPEIRLNLYVVFAAYHSNKDLYYESLKQLAYVVQFFQAKNVYNNIESPQLGDDIEQLTVELFTLNFEQQNQLWASLGAKYMPSVVYKVRMLVINERRAADSATAIGGFEAAFANNRE